MTSSRRYKLFQGSNIKNWVIFCYYCGESEIIPFKGNHLILFLLFHFFNNLKKNFALESQHFNKKKSIEMKQTKERIRKI